METESLSKTHKPPKFYVVGGPGSGKTTALGTLPPHMKGLLLNTYGNPQVLQGAPNEKSIELIDYEAYSLEDGSAFYQMDRDRKELESFVAFDEFPYDWICLDTGTGFSRVCENFALATHQKGKGMGGSPGEHHYRGISWLVAQYIYQIIALPCIIIVNTHLTDEKDDRLGTMVYKAYLAGTKNRTTIYGYFSEVYHAFGEPDEEKQGKNRYLWQTSHDASYSFPKSTFNRRQELYGLYIEPNYTKLFERTDYGEGGKDD